jgi:hypothetical protein
VEKLKLTILGSEVGVNCGQSRDNGCRVSHQRPSGLVPTPDTKLRSHGYSRCYRKQGRKIETEMVPVFRCVLPGSASLAPAERAPGVGVRVVWRDASSRFVPAVLDKGGAIVGSACVSGLVLHARVPISPMLLAAIGGDREGLNISAERSGAHSAGSENATALVIALRPRVASHREIT